MTQERIRFYAGVPLKSVDGHRIGTLCIKDHRPRDLDAEHLFCDVVGFSAYCRSSPPEAIIPRLQTLIEAYEEIAADHGLQKIKSNGDEFMATAGLLTPLDDPVWNCVRAGLEMVTATRGVDPGWQVRIGSYVGPVIAGVVGRRQYLFDLWGDVVNTAKRVESHGLEGAVPG